MKTTLILLSLMALAYGCSSNVQKNETAKTDELSSETTVAIDSLLHGLDNSIEDWRLPTAINNSARTELNK